jgi:hypothetical protein
LVFSGKLAEEEKMYSNYWYLRAIKVSTTLAERWQRLAALAEKSS